MRHYILQDGKSVEVPAPEWAQWMNRIGLGRVIKSDLVTVAEYDDQVRVSTVFLGMDHSFSDNAPPVLWETMIFGGKYDQFQNRYTSQEDALAGHARAVKCVKGEIDEEEAYGNGPSTD